jgi:hypothetical protein
VTSELPQWAATFGCKQDQTLQIDASLHFGAKEIEYDGIPTNSFDE